MTSLLKKFVRHANLGPAAPETEIPEHLQAAEFMVAQKKRQPPRDNRTLQGRIIKLSVWSAEQ